LKKILLLTTGGTIAMRSTGEGLEPVLSSRDILGYIPEAASFCDVMTRELMSIDSTNMHPVHWLKIAAAIEESFDSYDGFVIAHGTDTMAYTAAALSYLIQNCTKPIVITGSQKPMAAELTDAKINLLDSLRYASWDRAFGCVIVFGGKVISGTRARKMNTKSYDAFDSINYPVLGIIHDGYITEYMTRTRPQGKPFFYHAMNPSVFVLKLTPGVSSDILKLMKDSYQAFVLESYGVGGIPDGECYDFPAVISGLMDEGKTVVLTTQAIYEGSDISVYHSGHVAKEKYGVLEAHDMTLEATVTKLMWILSLTKDPVKIKTLFSTPIQEDLLPARPMI